MPVIEVVDDGGRTYRITGRLLGRPVSTAFDHAGRQRPRWLQAELRALDAGGYAVVQENLSLVWHLPDGRDHVRKPALVPFASLPENAVYCGNLQHRQGRSGCPLSSRDTVLSPFGGKDRPFPAPDAVLAELPQRRVFTGYTAQAIIAQVATERRRGPDGMSYGLSAPMRKLFAQAARDDPAFMDLRTVVDL